MAMIQIRNVPDDVHRTLKSRAALAGMSLSDYLLRSIRAEAEKPSLEEWLRRVGAHDPVELIEPAADLIRSERDSR